MDCEDNLGISGPKWRSLCKFALWNLKIWQMEYFFLWKRFQNCADSFETQHNTDMK